MADAVSVPESTARPPAGGLRGVAPVHNLLDDHRRKLHWSLLANGVLASRCWRAPAGICGRPCIRRLRSISPPPPTAA